jgi:hypothetical protein
MSSDVAGLATGGRVSGRRENSGHGSGKQLSRAVQAGLEICLHLSTGRGAKAQAVTKGSYTAIGRPNWPRPTSTISHQFWPTIRPPMTPEGSPRQSRTSRPPCTICFCKEVTAFSNVTMRRGPHAGHYGVSAWRLSSVGSSLCILMSSIRLSMPKSVNANMPSSPTP